MNVSVQQAPEEEEAGVDDALERFVREMDRLEGRHELRGLQHAGATSGCWSGGWPGTSMSAAS